MDRRRPPEELVLGVGSYRHSFLVNESVALTEQGKIAAYPQFEPEQPRGDSSNNGPVWVFVVKRPVGEVSLIFGAWLRAISWMRKVNLSRAFIILDWLFPSSGWTDAEDVCDAAIHLQLHLTSHGFIQ